MKDSFVWFVFLAGVVVGVVAVLLVLVARGVLAPPPVTDYQLPTTSQITEGTTHA